MANNTLCSKSVRIGLEVLSGIFAAMPLGLFLYFVPIIFWASAIGIVAILIALIPYAGIPIVAWMDFTPGMVLVLLSGVIAIEIWACKFLIKRHYQIFAYTQAVLGLAISSPFFYWTIIHHRPMLPFYGQ